MTAWGDSTKRITLSHLQCKIYPNSACVLGRKSTASAFRSQSKFRQFAFAAMFVYMTCALATMPLKKPAPWQPYTTRYQNNKPGKQRTSLLLVLCSSLGLLLQRNISGVTLNDAVKTTIEAALISRNIKLTCDCPCVTGCIGTQPLRDVKVQRKVGNVVQQDALINFGHIQYGCTGKYIQNKGETVCYCLQVCKNNTVSLNKVTCSVCRSVAIIRCSHFYEKYCLLPVKNPCLF